MSEDEIPTAGQIMTPIRLVLQPGMDILDGIDRLLELQVAAAAVVDAEGRLLGMLTEKDCLRVLSNSAYDDVFKEGSVADYMSPVRKVLGPHMDIFRTAEEFLSCNFPTLPVVDGERLVGRISRKDMLAAVQAFIADRSERREQQRKELAKAGKRPKSIEEMQQVAANTTPESLAGLFSRNR